MYEASPPTSERPPDPLSIPIGTFQAAYVSRSEALRLGEEGAQAAAEAKAAMDQAFTDIYNATSAQIYTLASRLVNYNVDSAQDVIQEVYRRVYSNLHNFRRESDFTTWSFRITANCANTYLKTKQRHKTEDLPDEYEFNGQIDPSSDPVHAVLNQESSNRIIAALRELPEDSKEIIIRFYIYGQRVTEIAGLVKKSEGAVKVQLHRAREKLRTRLLKVEAVDTPDIIMSVGDVAVQTELDDE